MSYAGQEKIDVAFGSEIDKTISNLSKLKEKWQEQGIYVDEFKSKVELLERSLNEINIGDIVVSTDALHHDVDVRVFGYPLGEVPQMGCLAFPADKHLSALAASVCREVNPDIKVYEGRVVSGDQFVSDKEKKSWLIKTFEGYCTEMEGAAIAQTAYLNKIPFLIIRAISDKADDSAKMNYEEFEAKAIEHSVQLVKELVQKLDFVYSA